ILLMVAGSLVVFFRRSAASVRHLVWSLTLASFLILPLISFVVPQWRLGLVSSITTSDSTAPVRANKRSQTPAQLMTNDTAPLAATNQQSATPVENGASNSSTELTATTTQATPNWSLRIMAIWFAGMLIVLARLLVGTIGIQRIVGSATPLTDSEWL